MEVNREVFELIEGGNAMYTRCLSNIFNVEAKQVFVWL